MTAATTLRKGPSGATGIGGAHSHPLQRDAEQGIMVTPLSGRHTHWFMLPSGELIETEPGGAHIHSGITSDMYEGFGYDGFGGGTHSHFLVINGVEFRTAEYDDGCHTHEGQLDTTTVSGTHTHIVQAGTTHLVSLTPQQLGLLTGLSVGPISEVLLTLRDPETPAAVVRHGATTEIRTEKATITLDHEGHARITNGWQAGGRPSDVGKLEVGWVDDDVVEFWFTTSDGSERFELHKKSDHWQVVANNRGPIALRDIPLIDDKLPEGISALPAYLRKAVPEKVRYWEKPSAPGAIRARRWLTATSWVGEAQTEKMETVAKAVNATWVLRDETDVKKLRQALAGRHIILATEGSEAEIALRKLGVKVGYMDHPDTAGCVVTSNVVALYYPEPPLSSAEVDQAYETFWRAGNVTHLVINDVVQSWARQVADTGLSEDAYYLALAQRTLDLMETPRSLWGADEVRKSAQVVARITSRTSDDHPALLKALGFDVAKDRSTDKEVPLPAFDLVVTRHAPLVEVLKERGLVQKDVQVLPEATKADVENKHVIGVLPHWLSCECASFTEVALEGLTLEDRDAMQQGDLSVERTREVAGPTRTYVVRELKIKKSQSIPTGSSSPVVAEKADVTKEQIVGWLVDHYKAGRLLSVDRIKKMLDAREQFDFLKPPADLTKVYRGLHNVTKAEVDRLRDGSTTSTTHSDKSWTASRQVAKRFAMGDFTKSPKQAGRYSVILTAAVPHDRALLNSEAIADLPGVGDAWSDLWQENLRVAVAYESEVIIYGQVEILDVEIIPNDGEPSNDEELVAVTLTKNGNEEERIVYGVVMEPLATDTQGETQTADTIRNAAYGYMLNYRNVGLQHSVYVNDRVSILESYVTRADQTIDGQLIKAGTWMMTMKIHDDEIWANIKSGRITGFSIGGRGIRVPIDREDFTYAT